MRDLSLLSSILAAGLYPNVSRRRIGVKNFSTHCGTTAKVHQVSSTSKSLVLFQAAAVAVAVLLSWHAAWIMMCMRAARSQLTM